MTEKPQILLWVLPLLWVHCFVQPGKTLQWQFSSLCVLMHWTGGWTRGKPWPTHKPKRRLQTAHRPSETPARRQTTQGCGRICLKLSVNCDNIREEGGEKRGWVGNNCCLNQDILIHHILHGRSSSMNRTAGKWLSSLPIWKWITLLDLTVWELVHPCKGARLL